MSLFDRQAEPAFAMDENQSRKCYGCGGDLRDGVRFCVRCGRNNFDPDAGRLAAAECEIGANNRKQSFERLTYWWRYFTSGIRR